MIIWSFVHLLTFLIYVYLGILVFVKDPKSSLNRVAFCFSSCFAIWTFGMIFIHNPDTPKSLLGIAAKIAPFGWIGFCSFILWFFLIFTEKTKVTQSRYFYLLLFILPVTLVYKQLSSDSIIVGYIEQPFGWMTVWGRSFWTYLYFFYVLLYVGTAIILIYDYWRKTSNSLKKKQTKIFFITGLISFIIGICSNIVLPILNIGTIPELATSFSLIWVVGSVYAMVRYQFLAITPATAADNIISTMADCLILLDEYGDIITVNEATLNLLHYDKEELCGRSVDTLFEEEHLRSGVSGDIIQRDNFKNRDDYFITKSGENIPVSLSCSALTDEAGETTGFVLIVRDMTEYKKTEQSLREAREGLEELVQERTEELEKTNVALRTEIKDKKLAEEALRASEEKYRTILESMEDGYFEVDIGGNFTFFNRALCERLGYAPEELMGMNYKAITDEENGKKMFHEFNKVFTTAIPIRNIESRVISKDGAAKIVETPISLIRDIYNEPIGFRGLLRDVTEQKSLQDQLQQAQKMEAIGTLAGGIAHDFNNLLMAIQARTDIMITDKDSSHPDFGHLRGIEDNVESAADLTKQLLGFARSGKYEVKPTDINELIKKQNRMFGRTKKEITIRGIYEKNLWSVEVDRGQIDQVILNLYINAWQAMPAGGHLYIQTQNVTLDENYTEPYQVDPGKYAKISITDTGIGMDKATQERIFDPFFTTKEMGRGTGLGLASAYGIIKNHGGFINVYSEKGEGSRFNIYLPASEKEATEEKKPAGDTLRGSETILFVDDEDMVIEVAEELLETLGYKVLTAGGGKEAIETYKKNKEQIDIVILDMVMPDMSGGETYDKLKEINPDIKVLLASGYSIHGAATEILDRGCNGFIQKPAKTMELSQKLREILDDK